jgi:hypothetical protein
MPRPKEDNKKEIIAAIRQHLMLVGPGDWDSLMAKYPDVSRSTFFRYIKQAREQVESAAAADSPGALKIAQQRIHAHVAKPEKTTERIKAHLPVMPSPAVIARDPGAASQAFQFFAFFNSIVADAELMRGTAVVRNEDGTEKVRNPAMLDKVITRRLGIAQTYLHAFEAVYNAERIRELYDAIVEEVGKAAPDVQMAVLARMRELDNKRGLTMNGDV